MSRYRVSPLFIRSGQGHPVPVDQPFDVIDHIHHSDFGGCPGDPDGSDEEVHLVLLGCEDVFDATAGLGLQAVRPPRRRRQPSPCVAGRSRAQAP